MREKERVETKQEKHTPPLHHARSAHLLATAAAAVATLAAGGAFASFFPLFLFSHFSSILFIIAKIKNQNHY